MVILIVAAIYFTGLTHFIQVRHFKESVRLVMEQPAESGSMSSFQALMVSTASRVGTGNIVGVSTALCLGGPGAMFWMCLSSGIAPSEELSGAPYVQAALGTVFKNFGPVFITIAMILFAFTTLLGNLYYVDMGLAYLNGKKLPGKVFMTIFHLICAAVVLLGAIAPMNICWDLADITMGGMTIINIPVCMLLGKTALDTLRDYEKQKKNGKDPKFLGEDIGLNPNELDYWNSSP